jgi:hypothetical protein
MRPVLSSFSEGGSLRLQHPCQSVPICGSKNIPHSDISNPNRPRCDHIFHVPSSILNPSCSVSAPARMRPGAVCKFRHGRICTRKNRCALVALIEKITGLPVPGTDPPKGTQFVVPRLSLYSSWYVRPVTVAQEIIKFVPEDG